MGRGGRLTRELDVEEVDVVRGCVYDGPDYHRVGNLAVEPDVLVCGEEAGQFGAEEGDEVAKHGEEEECSVKDEDDGCASGDPDGPSEGVERGESGIGDLREG